MRGQGHRESPEKLLDNVNVTITDFTNRTNAITEVILDDISS